MAIKHASKKTDEAGKVWVGVGVDNDRIIARIPVEFWVTTEIVNFDHPIS